MRSSPCATVVDEKHPRSYPEANRLMATDALEPDSHATEGDGDEDIVRANWGSLFSFTTRKHIFTLTVALLLSLVSGIVIPTLAYFLGTVFDSFADFGAGTISGSDLTGKVSERAIYLVLLGIASWFSNGIYFMFWIAFGELQAKSTRDRLFHAMLEKEMEWYDMRKDGVNAMVQRLHTQIRELQMATSQPLGFAMQYAVTIVVALGLAMYNAWDLALVTLATVPIAALFLAWISARMQPAIDGQTEQLTIASKLVGNAISAIDTVKSFNGQEFETWQYVDTIRRAAKYYLRQAHANGMQIGLVRLMTLGMFVQGFWYGSHLVDTGRKTSGQVLTAFWASLMATQSFEQILPQLLVLEKGRTAGATLKAILLKMDHEHAVGRNLGRSTPMHCDGDVQMQNISFAYPSQPEQLALVNASFFFPAGQTTFIVGKSGSGKSTLANLLLRFYNPINGEITIDGQPLQSLDINWLRNNITLVQQQSILFNETILKNIAFGRRDHQTVKKSELKRCVELAALTETINELPKGLDTLVGIGGNSMSGGQRQRIAIARARLRDTPILILDEATSALDHTSKMSVMEAIRQWRSGKTTIIITHDISQIQDEDFVYVLQYGQIVQEGYRSTLQHAFDGPFASFMDPYVEFPNTPQVHIQSARSRTGGLGVVPGSSGSSDNDRDSMDLRVVERSSIIPRVYFPSPERSRDGRRSVDFATALPPVVVHMHRMSNARMSMLPLRNYSSSLQALSPSTGESPVEMILLSSTWPSDTVSPDLRRRISKRFSSGQQSAKLIFDAQKATQQVAGRIMPLKDILETVWPRLNARHRLTLIAGFSAAMVQAASTPVFSWVFSRLLATYISPINRAQVALKWSMAVLGVAVVDASASYLMHYLLEVCGQAWIDGLRLQAMQRILDQPRAWFDGENNDPFQLTECLDRNAEEMRNLVGRFAGFGLVTLAMTAIALVWCLVSCWKLTLAGISVAPLMYALTRGFETFSGKWEARGNVAAESAGRIFTETFGNIRTVRALTLEGYFHRKHTKATVHALMVGLKRAGYSGLFFGISDASIIFITALIFWYGSTLASAGDFSVSAILTVFTMLLFTIANANAIITFIPQISSSRDTAARLLRLSQLPLSASHEHDGTIRLLALPSPIRFTNLTFAYPSRPAQSVLTNFTLTIPLHTSTAIVGASGSGKSTIAALLLNLYPSTAGGHHQPLTIGNLPLSALHTSTYRSLLAFVPQTPALFPATIAANIAYGLSSRSSLNSTKSIQRAAALAGIHTFVASLPLGYDTLVGDGGIGLSGGQMQRLSLARALVRKPRFLIMDEPTSSLDAETARDLRQMIVRLADGGVTVVCITHSWEMMRAMRRVVVLENGRVAEEGAFDELMGRREGALSKLLGMGEGVG